MSDTLTATACMFMRKKNSDWEVGIAISDKGPGIYDIDVIVDNKGKAVKAPIWSYNLLEEKGTFTFNSDEIIKIW
ncbi:MAG: hypothetical protein IH810_04875 [Proteobacteria bacterium]|nr:hypothetical protein [Pseudomonadota bacterium]